ncbi:MAG: DUF4982 domain-containing protein [Oscillospiraceae bacterium]|nr:DUF4982 domain-containing protein [Oscillospiraceae bacterium]
MCSNAPRVALFLDGASLGAVALEGRLIADWQVPYRSGVLRAVAYDEAGAAVAEAERRSFGDTAALVLREETFGGLLFVTVTAVDADGNPVDNACDRVKVTADGGRLLGLDNGDATDWEQYTAGSRRLFSGKLLAIVKPEGDGTARVTAALDKSDVPIRKIELARDGWRVTAQIFPADATYDDLAWRLTDAGGIDSPLGALKVAGDGRSAEIVPHGDGAVYIRCAAKNGRAHPTVISLLPMTIEGVGQSFLDPYVFLSAGLYNAGNVEMTNGNERGVATPRTGESHVGFTGLDFGDYGSDEVTLPLFPLDKEPFDFELWEGMPSEGGEKLCTVRWDKGSVWNTYQDITVKLPRRLKGVTALCLVFRQKVHIKGFRFTRLQKAFERLPAAACDRIYGDAYTVRPPAVEGIGNNVTLAFEHMDFGETGAGRVALRWRSRLAKNAIQLLFEGPEGQRRQVVEALRAEAYTEAVFPLDRPVFGPQTVQLVFLPGCELDLEWIRFEA